MSRKKAMSPKCHGDNISESPQMRATVIFDSPKLRSTTVVLDGPKICSTTIVLDGPKLLLTGGPLDHCPKGGRKLRLSVGPLDHRPFGRLSFVNLDGPNYAIWTKEPSSTYGKVT